ncbi:MAG: DUF6259 domain-containing protein [Armatimonadota bacterium]|nr:DUF6259 domain-containing protein [Armatimonadota bacterium]
MRSLAAVVLALLAIAVEAQGRVGWRVDTSKAALWQPMPAWLGNPDNTARVERTAEGLRFVVAQEGRGMKWLYNASWVNTQRFRYLVVRYRARGLHTDSNDYFLYLNDNSGLPLASRFVLSLADLRADGEWHWAAVDVRERGIRPYLIQMALQVQASGASAEVVIADISFRDTLPAGVVLAREPDVPYREQILPLSELERLQAQPAWLNNPSARAMVERKPDGIHLRVPEAGRGMKWSVRLNNPLRLHATPYVIVQYRATGVASSGDYFLYMAPEQPDLPQEEYTPLRLNELVALGKWRTLVARVPRASVDALTNLAIQVQAAEPNAEVVIRSVQFASRPREPLGALHDELPEPRAAVDGKFSPVDLSARYNLNVKQVATALPLSDYRFRHRRVVAAGVPFIVGAGGRNVVSIQGEVGDISVPLPPSLQKQAPSEVYLLLAADFPQWEEPSYGGGTLYRVQHPHRVVVQLHYTDGTSEEVFPLRVTSGRPEVVAGIDVYVVPASRRLKEVRLRDRMRLGEFGVCAVTLNAGKRRFASALWTTAVPVRGRQGAWNTPSRVEIKEADGKLILQDANVRLQIDTVQGVRLQEFSLLPIRRNILTKPVPLFAVRSWDSNLSTSSEEYRVAKVSAHASGALLECTPPHSDLPFVRLQLQMDSMSGLRVGITVHNQGTQPHRWVVNLPQQWTFRISENDVYTCPLRTLFISDRDGDWRFRYSGAMPLQMIDISNHRLGVGAGMCMTDLEGTDRYLHLIRQNGSTTIRVEWRCEPLAPGQTKRLEIDLFPHAGDWRQTFAHYRRWTNTWYRPLAPRKQWFRKAFAFRQDYIGEGLYDRNAQVYRFAERVALAQRAFGACDYLHLFDWGTTPLGRVGDYDPWGNPLTSAQDFRQAVEATQAQGVPIGLYIEGYLADVRSRVAQTHLEEWGWRGREGQVLRWSPESTEFFMCPGAAGWQQYLVETYQRVNQQTGAKGYYIDEFGFCDRDCFAQQHEHPVDWHLLPAEGTTTRRIREALPPETVLYTESFPPDIHTILQDGSFDYAIYYYQTTLRHWTPLPLRLSRFAFPDFKVFQIIVCDMPTGSNEEAIRQVFFNGDGYWLQGNPQTWFTPESMTILRKCIRILRDHADAFASDDCEPLVPTLQEGVFANRFTAGDGRKTVWTLYNANWRSVQGEVIAVPHLPGARYIDAWSGNRLHATVKGNWAILSLQLSPRGVGCIMQLR